MLYDHNSFNSRKQHVTNKKKGNKLQKKKKRVMYIYIVNKIDQTHSAIQKQSIF